MEVDNYKKILKQKLTERCSTNKHYSLRAFARDIGLESSLLSRILSGTRKLSSQSAQLVAHKLFPNANEKDYFLALVNFENANKLSLKEVAAKELEKFQQQNEIISLQLDSFYVISDWYHYAIMDMTGLKNFRNDPKFIASQLGITEIEVKLAIERLIRLGLLDQVNGKLKKTSVNIVTPSGKPNEGLRKFHKQMISKALTSIDEQSVEERMNQALTFNLNKKNLSKYFSAVENFISEIRKIANQEKNSDELYQLNIQLFNLRGKTK